MLGIDDDRPGGPMSARILILYGTSYGQTAKVAQYIGDCITSRGGIARIVDADQIPAELTLRDFDGVIIGASVIRGQHQRAVKRFVMRQRELLNAMPAAFFSVSGSAASRDESGKRDAEGCIASFLHATGWQPAHVESIAGAMAYTKYNVLYRWILKQISKRNGGPTDTSRDHDLTDWAQVQQFAEVFLDAIPDGALNGAG
jgi:menaquinone-dependent protoporphyrinogen oxidase